MVKTMVVYRSFIVYQIYHLLRSVCGFLEFIALRHVFEPPRR